MNSAPKKSEHEIVWRDLPWYVNGSLEKADRDRAERHLESCAMCRSELELLKQVSQEVKAQDTFEEEKLASSLHRLHQQIDAESTGAQASRIRGNQKRRWLSRVLGGFGIGPIGARVIIAAQTAAIVVLAVVIHRPDLQMTPEFETLSTEPAHTTGTDERLRVKVNALTTERRLRHILTELDLQIVAGPTPTGIYTLARPMSPHAETTLGELAERLNRSVEIQLALPLKD